MPAYPPISKEGYEAICKYLDQALAHARDPNQPEPDTSLLLIGLPQGSILNITPDLGLQVRDTGEEGELEHPGTLTRLLSRCSDCSSQVAAQQA
jgi:hypothetical protein